MAERTWHSVFNDLSEACGILCYYRLELLNDPGFVEVIGGRLQIVCMREENEAKAIYDLLGKLTPPSEKAKKAMRSFCARYNVEALLIPEDERATNIALGNLNQPLHSPSMCGDASAGPVAPSSNEIAKAFSRAFRSPRLRKGVADTVEDAGGHAEKRGALRDTLLTLPLQGLCFGRSAKLDHMSRVLQGAVRPTHCAIIGGGGIGKTSLANALVHDERMVETFRQRRYWVNLDGRLTRLDLVQSIVNVLPIPSHSNLDTIRSFLASNSALLVLDDLDAMAAEEGPRSDLSEVLDLLAATCCIVITLREARPLGTVMTWHEVVRLERLDAVSAARTFCAVADAHTDDPDLDPLIEQCDGHPLAIRLLSRQAVAGEPLSQLRRRWDKQRSQLLCTQVPGTKLDNLAVSVELTLNHPRMRTDEDAWILLRLLAPMNDGFSFDQFEKLFQDTGVPSSLGTLLDLGIVFPWRLSSAAKSNQDQRYSIITPVRGYILDTITCPPLWMVKDSLREPELSRVRLYGPAARRMEQPRSMRLFELMTCHLLPQRVVPVCIGFFPEQPLRPKPRAVIAVSFELWGPWEMVNQGTLSPLAVVTPTGSICRPAVLPEHVRIPAFDAVAASLRRLRSRYAQPYQDSSAFDPDPLRWSMQSMRRNGRIARREPDAAHTEIAENGTTHLNPAPSKTRWHELTTLNLSGGAFPPMACDRRFPTFFCFLFKSMPVKVIINVGTPASPDSVGKLGNWPLMKEVGLALSVFVNLPLGIAAYDRARACFGSVLQPITLDIVDANCDSSVVPFAVSGQGQTSIEKQIMIIRRKVAARAVALCVRAGQNEEARRRVLLETPFTSLPWQMDDLVRELSHSRDLSRRCLDPVEGKINNLLGKSDLGEAHKELLKFCRTCLHELKVLPMDANPPRPVPRHTHTSLHTRTSQHLQSEPQQPTAWRRLLTGTRRKGTGKGATITEYQMTR